MMAVVVVAIIIINRFLQRHTVVTSQVLAAGRIRVHNGRLLVFLRMTNSVGCWRVNLEHDADGLPVVPQC